MALLRETGLRKDNIPILLVDQVFNNHKHDRITTASTRNKTIPVCQSGRCCCRFRLLKVVCTGLLFITLDGLKVLCRTEESLFLPIDICCDTDVERCVVVPPVVVIPMVRASQLFSLLSGKSRVPSSTTVLVL